MIPTISLLRTASCLYQGAAAFAPSPRAFRQSPPTSSTSPTTRQYQASRSLVSSTSTSLAAVPPKNAPGSIVTIDCDLQPEGDFVPEVLIATSGKLAFALHGGNYLPGLHDLVSDIEINR